MRAIIFKELRERRTSLIVYCLAGIGLVWLYIGMYPSLQSQATEFAKLINALPKGYLKAFGIEGTGLENVESLLASKQFTLVWPILTVILLLSRAGNMLAGEIERGTIGTLLSLPISRTKIYLSKLSAGLITLGLFTATSTLVCIPVARLYHVSYSTRSYLLMTVLGFFFGYAVLGVSMAASAICNDRGSVYSMIGGSLLVMYVLNLVAGFQLRFDKLKYASVFHYFDANQPLLHQRLDGWSLLLFAVLGTISILIGLQIFNNRDISI